MFWIPNLYFDLAYGFRKMLIEVPLRETLLDIGENCVCTSGEFKSDRVFWNSVRRYNDEVPSYFCWTPPTGWLWPFWKSIEVMKTVLRGIKWIWTWKKLIVFGHTFECNGWKCNFECLVSFPSCEISIITIAQNKKVSSGEGSIWKMRTLTTLALYWRYWFLTNPM